jgi:hypothetical protein
LGVADFGYDFYLLAIAKLLHGQYFRLLDFYFHTLIQQRPYLLPVPCSLFPVPFFCNKRWYKENIPIADQRYEKYLEILKEEN